jgi:hypothetical protein
MTSRSHWILALMLFLSVEPASAARLVYVLSSPLAKNHGPGLPHTSYFGVCQNDQDGDCLDDAMENRLAELVNPSYYFDQNESCPARYVYFQVRPQSSGVDTWRVDGVIKLVHITYFFNYEKDCKIDGHLGDSERVIYTLQSTDLQTWSLESGVYYRHTGFKSVSGDYLATFARALGRSSPVIASEHEGHGSWEGASPYNHDCSPDAAFFRSCFNRSEARLSTPTPNPLLHNIGGPDQGRIGGPERWRPHPEHLIVSGRDVYTPRNGKREYWTRRDDLPESRRFCGWQCSQRYPDGTCNTLSGNPLFAQSSCAGALDGKLDRAYFDKQSRPITAADNGGRSLSYSCTQEVPTGGTTTLLTWTYRGDGPQGHLRYTAQDSRGTTFYYRLWYVGIPEILTQRWILEQVAPNDWEGRALNRCDQFDVSVAGSFLRFAGPSGTCSNGVRLQCQIIE